MKSLRGLLAPQPFENSVFEGIIDMTLLGVDSERLESGEVDHCEDDQPCELEDDGFGDEHTQQQGRNGGGGDGDYGLEDGLSERPEAQQNANLERSRKVD